MANRSMSQPVDGKRVAPPESVAPSPNSWTGRDWTWAALLVVAVILTYQPLWHAGFIWDDDFHVTENPLIVGPLGLKEIWTPAPGNFYPLVLTTFWIEHALWGLEPVPYHLVNVLQYAVSMVVLWRVLLSLHIPGAWLGAALFALHPLQVESVAWVAELKNTQSGLFYLLAILFFIRWLREASFKWSDKNYVLTLIFAALAMASKSSTVVLPVVLALCAWWVEGRWKWQRLLPLIPIFLMSLLSTAVTMWAPKSLVIASAALHPVSNWPGRIATAGDAFWFYLGKLLWPHPLMTVYPRWQIDATQWTSYLPFLAAILLFVILWLGRRSELRPVSFAFAYYLVALGPFLGLLDQSFWRFSQVEDHLQYLAGIGPVALIAAGLTGATTFLPESSLWLRSTLGAGLLLVLGIASWQRAGDYQSSARLWTDELRKNPNCWPAYVNLSLDLEKKGHGQEALDQAIVGYRKALALNPNFTEAYNDLANALLKEGKTDEAIADYRMAVEIYPGFAAGYRNLGNVYKDKGDLDEAIVQYQKSLEIDPLISTTRNNLGMLYLQKGDDEKAMSEFQKVIEFDPDNDLPHYSLGMVYARKGQMDRATSEFQKAIDLNPKNAESLAKFLATRAPKPVEDDAISRYQAAIQANPKNAGAHNDLGSAYAQGGKWDDAITQYRQALDIDPADPMTRYNLGAVLLQKGDLDEAQTQLQKVLAVVPNNDVAHYCLGLVYARKGHADQAITEYQKALKINPNNAQARKKLGTALSPATPTGTEAIRNPGSR